MYHQLKHYFDIIWNLCCLAICHKQGLCLSFVHIAGFTALKLTPLPLCTDFVDASKVRNLIHLKGYFKGSDNSWDHALDGVMHHDLALCALGGLLGHLSRLKVSLFLCPFLF